MKECKLIKVTLGTRLSWKSFSLFRYKQFEGRRRSDSFLYHCILLGVVQKLCHV